MGRTERTMARATIQDWTESMVITGIRVAREFQYQVYRDDEKTFQEIRELDGSPIHTIEIPDGINLDRGCYEVLLRYVLTDVVAV